MVTYYGYYMYKNGILIYDITIVAYRLQKM